jgi:hypothetical protein
MRITFFKTGKPKNFKYTPRYYSEQKEEFDKRQNRIKQELGANEKTSGYRSRLSEGVMTERFHSKHRSGRASTLRLLIIIAILTLLALYLLRDFESINSIFK